MSTNKQQIIDYVLKTPHNTNKLVLSGLLDSFKGSGATPSPSIDTEKPAVRLLDWEGTTLQIYTAEEALNLINLPNPSTLEGYNDIDHEYLVFQTWNWDLEDIKDWIDDNPGFTLPVGAIYNTSDGENHEVIYGEKLEGISNTRDYIIALKIGDMSTVDFSDYPDLRYITIPQGATDFTGPIESKIRAINIPSTMEDFSFEFDSDDTDVKDTELSFPKVVDSVNLHLGARQLSSFVLLSCTNLVGFIKAREIILPRELTVIKGNNNESDDLYFEMVKKIDIPDSVESIGNKAFISCEFEEVTLPNTLEVLGCCAFQYCEELEKIEIPSTIQGIGNNTFEGCHRLTDVLIKGEIPLSNLNGFPLRPFAIVRVYVPADSIEYYRTQTNWAAMYVNGFILPIEDNIEHLESIGFNVDEYKVNEI